MSATMREMISEMSGSIKTKLIVLFDEWYADVASTVVAATMTTIIVATSPIEKEIPYHEFNNTKPLEFDSVRDPIVSTRRVSNVEGRFYIFAFSANLKFRYVQNLLCHGAKDRWNFVTKDYSPTEKRALTWEQFVETFKEEYPMLVEREGLAHEFLLLKQTTESVT